MSRQHEATSHRPELLVVDDERPSLDTLARILRRYYRVHLAETPQEAMQVLTQRDIAVIVADYHMPEMNGVQLLAEAGKKRSDAKRVLITGHPDIEGVIDAINLSKIDALVRKPWDARKLEATIETLLTERSETVREKERLGTLEQHVVSLSERERQLSGNLEDVSRSLRVSKQALERANRELASAAHRDGLTGFFNHRSFQERLREELNRARQSGHALALVCADVDHFKAFNALFGHPSGDEVLRQLAKLFLSVRSPTSSGGRPAEVVARYGGEEFMLLLPETSKEAARQTASELRETIAAAKLAPSVGADGTPEQPLTMSFGVACFPDDAEEPELLIECVSRALLAAKKSGRNRVIAYGELSELADWQPPANGAPSIAARGSKPDSAAAIAFDEEEAFTHAKSPDFSQSRTVAAARVIGPMPGAMREMSFYSSGLVTHDHSAARYLGTLAFPSIRERLEDIGRILDQERVLCALYIDLSRFRRVESQYGSARHAALAGQIGEVLAAMRGTHVREGDILCRTDDGDSFVMFLTPPRGGGVIEQPEVLAERVENLIQTAVGKEIYELVNTALHAAVGFARVLANPMLRLERLVSKVVEDAKDSGQLMRKRRQSREKEMLQELILSDGELLRAVYQPIVHLASGETFGYEALARGPKDSPLESPLTLFGVAEENHLLFELDRACFRMALKTAQGAPAVPRMFVNLLPMSFYDITFIEREVLELLEGAGLTPANLVFEITERLAIENFSSFRRALAAYTSMGFGVAVDDVGTKHSNLEAVMALRPHFIKLSDILTRGVARSNVKREMLKSLKNIAEAIDAAMVAEGIETEEDLLALKELGVGYGQGYFLARPGPPFPEVSDEVRRITRGSDEPRVRDPETSLTRRVTTLQELEAEDGEG